jgi:hypothetical protein
MGVGCAQLSHGMVQSITSLVAGSTGCQLSIMAALALVRDFAKSPEPPTLEAPAVVSG